MVDIEQYLEQYAEGMIEERSNFEPGSKERVQHDKNVSTVVGSIVDLKRLESDDFNEERRIEFEKNKFEAQLNHDEKWKAEEMNQRIVEHESEVKLKETQTQHEKKIGWAKIGVGAASLAGTFALHLLSRSDAREGIMLDDRQKFVDKARNSIMNFLR